MTYQTFCTLAKGNSGGLRQGIGSPINQECCGLWKKKLTVADSGGNIPYVFQEMVTKVIWNVFRQSDLHEIRFHMSAWVVFISEGEGGIGVWVERGIF